MQIGAQFSIAAHILLGAAYFGAAQKITSEFLASSGGVNAAVIRKILGALKSAGLIEVARGTGGVSLARSAESITLSDVFMAIEPLKNGKLFKIHAHSEPRCPIGKHICALLAPPLNKAQLALESELAKTTIADLLRDLALLS